jgi:hypothetical protein
VGITTGNRDQASHPHHSWAARPGTLGPVPQSYGSYRPGSEIQGRYIRRPAP